METWCLIMSEWVTIEEAIENLKYNIEYKKKHPNSPFTRSIFKNKVKATAFNVKELVKSLNKWQ